MYEANWLNYPPESNSLHMLGISLQGNERCWGKELEASLKLLRLNKPAATVIYLGDELQLATDLAARANHEKIVLFAERSKEIRTAWKKQYAPYKKNTDITSAVCNIQRRNSFKEKFEKLVYAYIEDTPLRKSINELLDFYLKRQKKSTAEVYKPTEDTDFSYKILEKVVNPAKKLVNQALKQIDASLKHSETQINSLLYLLWEHAAFADAAETQLIILNKKRKELDKDSTSVTHVSYIYNSFSKKDRDSHPLQSIARAFKILAPKVNEETITVDICLITHTEIKPLLDDNLEEFFDTESTPSSNCSSYDESNSEEGNKNLRLSIKTPALRTQSLELKRPPDDTELLKEKRSSRSLPSSPTGPSRKNEKVVNIKENNNQRKARIIDQRSLKVLAGASKLLGTLDIDAEYEGKILTLVAFSILINSKERPVEKNPYMLNGIITTKVENERKEKNINSTKPSIVKFEKK